MCQSVLHIPKVALRHQRSTWRPSLCIQEAHRGFAASCPQQAEKGSRRRQQAVATQMTKRSAPAHPKSAAKKEMMNMTADKIPDDVGVLPNTIVMPPFSKHPSIFREPGLFTRLHWDHIKNIIQNNVALLAYKFFFWRGVTAAKPLRPKIQRLTIVRHAKDLHKKLYAAFAAGNETALKDLCCKGLRSEYSMRIARRKPGETVHWKLVRYVNSLISPRVVSHKCGGMGASLGDLPIGIQQAVVKMKSIQMMKTIAAPAGRAKQPPSTAVKEGSAEEVDWTGAKEKAVVEYMVLQRRLLKGVYEDWKVWGFAKELDVDEFRKERDEKAQRLRDTQAGKDTQAASGQFEKEL
ncbi:hypothetical protein EJ08DRAFT_666816 [Tothia fuscella]|uniref:Uncharacterized protein n=1 Tax=Tothia fuscella TaxID=1048955 RepID=A0A9P4NE20_9PEZI|nr:hypothetical protein EJ08DRAFT_666816 [Tothia fuscella]